METQVVHALAEVLRGVQYCVAGRERALGVPDLTAGLVALIWCRLLGQAHGAAAGPTALATAVGGAGCPPPGSKGIHAGDLGTIGQDEVIGPVAIEVPAEATDPATEGAGDGYEDMGIAIKEKPQCFGRLQNHVPALGGHPHVTHSHRQGHSFFVHSDLGGKVREVRDSQNHGWSGPLRLLGWSHVPRRPFGVGPCPFRPSDLCPPHLPWGGVIAPSEPSGWALSCSDSQGKAISTHLWPPSQSHNLASHSHHQLLDIAGRILLEHNAKVLILRLWVADFGQDVGAGAM